MVTLASWPTLLNPCPTNGHAQNQSETAPRREAQQENTGSDFSEHGSLLRVRLWSNTLLEIPRLLIKCRHRLIAGIVRKIRNDVVHDEPPCVVGHFGEHTVDYSADPVGS